MAKLAVCNSFRKMIIDLCLCFQSGAGSCRAQNHKAVLRYAKKKESPNSEQTDCTPDMVEQKSRNHITIALLMLKKAFKIIKTNFNPTAMATKLS